MPDESDVARTLAATIRLAMTGQTFAGTADRTGSMASWTANVRRGWPEPSELKLSITSKTALIRIYPRPGMSRDVTRYPTSWSASPVAPTLTVSVAALTATFAGTCALGQAAAIHAGLHVYAYRIQAGDTPATVAAALGAPIPAATVSGASVTAPLLRDARTGADSLATREVRRQQQSYMVTIWCADPAVRDSVSSAVDAAVAGLADAGGNIRPFIAMADGTMLGPVIYENTTSFDKGQDADVYRRDLYYRIEYPTLQTQTQPVMLFGVPVLDGAAIAPGAG